VHQKQGEGSGLLDEVLAGAFPERTHTLHLDVVPASAARHRGDDHPLLVEDIQVSPPHRLDMVVTDTPSFARAQSSSIHSGVSSIFHTNVEEFSSIRASKPLHTLPCPRSYPSIP
jgi:hypothetical protein